MKVILNLTLVMFMLSGFCSCGEDEDSISVKDTLTSNSWKLSSYIEDGEIVPLEACQKDDYLTFSADGTFNDYRGPLTCPGGIQTDISGTWTLSQDEKTLTITSTQGVESFTIEVTQNGLKLMNSFVTLILVPK